MTDVSLKRILYNFLRVLSQDLCFQFRQHKAIQFTCNLPKILRTKSTLNKVDIWNMRVIFLFLIIYVSFIDVLYNLVGRRKKPSLHFLFALQCPHDIYQRLNYIKLGIGYFLYTKVIHWTNRKTYELFCFICKIYIKPEIQEFCFNLCSLYNVLD